MSPIHAIYDNGVFRPLGAVDLVSPCEVTFIPQVVEGTKQDSAAAFAELSGFYALLGSGQETGISDLAARDNEHQP